jgi:hypothetical protein
MKQLMMLWKSPLEWLLLIAFACGAPASAAMKKQTFGKTPAGEAVEIYTLHGGARGFDKVVWKARDVSGAAHHGAMIV